ncbi:MAG: M48 family metalloprotease [Deltaproteobacteria bacterium]|nr:M48 family metalloprotease [Deltaproteobacteria bacterium]MBW2594796.1 M48 family metalloprotease [Deltaproteobacteria bacterium]
MKSDTHHIITKIFAIFVAILCLHASSGLSLASFTIEDEKKLGKEFYEKLKAKDLFAKNPKVNKYVDRIGHLLLSHDKKSFFDFTFSVINNPGINAFATPGGYVYIYSGLIELTENEDQLAGVLAHEIGHIKARHIAQTIDKSKKINIATLAAILAGAFLGGSGELTAAVASFSMATATTLNLKYSRKHEEEADRLGMSYLVETGYNGEGMLTFLKIMRKYEFYSNFIPSYFLTHPGTGDRIVYLDGLLQTRYTKKGAESIVGGLERVKTILVIDRKDLDSSLRYFQNILKKDPNSPNALYGLAVIQGKLGKTMDSFANFHRAISLSPDDAEILRDLGISHFNLGNTADAIDALQKAHSIDEKDSSTIFYLGRSYETTGDYSASLRFYEEFLKKNPDDIPIYYNLAMLYGKIDMPGESHYHFGIFFKKKHRFKSALFHFKAAQAFFPPDSEMAGKIRKEIPTSRDKHPANHGDERAKD